MILLLTLLFIAPPDSISLDACYQLAEAHHPLQNERALINEISALKIDNLNVRFLPALSLRSQATYQSHVPTLPFSVPGTSPPTISKDQYRVSLNATSLLFDSGLTAGQRKLEKIQQDLSQQELSVKLYQLKDQINAAFFGVLIQDARLASLALLAADLEAKHAQMLAGVRADAVLQGNADVLEVEILKVSQQQTEAQTDRTTALAVLSELTGTAFEETDTLIRPPHNEYAVALPEIDRPELNVFELNRSLLAQQQELSARKSRLQISTFAEASYGRPAGLDIFDNTFQPFYSFGLQMQWPFWDWRRGQRERATLALQQERATVQEDAFTQQITVASQEALHNIDKLNALIERDAEILVLRERIADMAASRLANGVITATEYLIERHALQQAQLTRDLHEIQLAFAHVQFKTLSGTP